MFSTFFVESKLSYSLKIQKSLQLIKRLKKKRMDEFLDLNYSSLEGFLKENESLYFSRIYVAFDTVKLLNDKNAEHNQLGVRFISFQGSNSF